MLFSYYLISLPVLILCVEVVVKGRPLGKEELRGALPLRCRQKSVKETRGLLGMAQAATSPCLARNNLHR